MISAVDTNVFLDIVEPNEEFFEASAQALEDSVFFGSVVICDLVYAEVCVHFNTQEECDRFLKDVHVQVETLNRTALFSASRVWREYRRRGGQRDRILTDFLIGAHAQTQANRLLSRDRGFYRKYFPSLTVFYPTHK